MARASLTIVRRITYDNLGLTNQTSGYGNLQTNERYLTGYIDDAIAQADLAVSELLLTNKQTLLMSESILELAGTSPITIDNTWFITSVDYFGDIGGTRRPAEQITYEQWERINFDVAGIYNSNYLYGTYAIENGKCFISTFAQFGGDDGVVSYINLSHPSSLSALLSPAGFESAVANLASGILLMKRGDNPEQSQFHINLFKEFMAIHLPPNSNIPEYN